MWRNRHSGKGYRLSRRSWVSVRELAFWSASCCVSELERAAAAARAGLAGVGDSCGGGGEYADGMGDERATTGSMETYYGL